MPKKSAGSSGLNVGQGMTTDRCVAVVEKIDDVETSEKPFGKRYGQEEISLTPEHIDVLKAGGLIALDVQNEYIVYLNLKK